MTGEFKYKPAGSVRLSQSRRQLQGAQARAFRLVQILRPSAKPLVQRGMHGRQARIGGCVVRVELNGALEHRRALEQVRLCHPRQVLPPAKVVFEGRRPGSGPDQRMTFLAAEHAASKVRRDGFGDFVLDGKYVRQLAIEALRPTVITSCDIDELHGDTELIAAFAHAALQQRAHIELPTDVAHVHTRGPELKGRRAGNDTQAIQTRQDIDQLLGQPLTQIVLIAPGAHVGERQHRDGRDTCCRGGLRRICVSEAMNR